MEEKRIIRLRVKEILEDRGLSVQDLSDGAGIAYNTALAYQRDYADGLSKRVLGKIVAFLKVEPGELFAIEEYSKTT